MKYKKLTKDQIKISLDRLTRFKFTKEKYLRVFTDIILNNLIEPKYKRQDIESMDYSQIKRLAVEIFNASINTDSDKTTIGNLNLKIKEYENLIFNNDENTQLLLDNEINYEAALEVLEEEIPVNLRWLKSLLNSNDLVSNREINFLKFPIEKVLLVEGLTEETLLPAFSRFLGYDFYQKGIQVIPAGGKNQVVKMYYKLVSEVNIPIFLLLDKDAEDNIRQITPKLRDIDKIHLVSCGEFEDLLPKSLIIKTVNSHLTNFGYITNSDFDETLPKAKNLELIFKTKGLHEFKKANFAKLVRDNITEESDVSEEIREIIKEIFL